MSPEAILHPLELLYTVDTLRFFLRVHEARKGFAKFWSTRSMGHTAQAWTVPVDLPGDGIVCSSAGATFRLAGSLLFWRRLVSSVRIRSFLSFG